MENKRNTLSSALLVLPRDLHTVLKNAPKKILDGVMEIILRVNRPLCVECKDKRYYFTQNNCVTDTIFDQKMVIVSAQNIFETFQNICNYSVYSRQHEINNGYITLKGGHRAGICGSAVVSNNKITNIKDITSINIRVAREVFGCSEEMYNKVDFSKGVLICGAPCSGKTTLIRDIARKLSYEKKVSVIDERGELACTVSGVFQNDIGMCDVYDSYIKADAINHSLRTMSPDIIVCDEISTIADVNALCNGVNSGVSFVATIHADSLENLLSRGITKEILKTNAFSQIVFLHSRENVGKISSIHSLDEIGGEYFD
ncbi:MAG: hypothetical protein E7513_01565 [Ruminococcaceae bacterium]|nr:hypothetical protein [Oscillospiraceae bacterium]